MSTAVTWEKELHLHTVNRFFLIKNCFESKINIESNREPKSRNQIVTFSESYTPNVLPQFFFTLLQKKKEKKMLL